MKAAVALHVLSSKIFSPPRQQLRELRQKAQQGAVSGVCLGSGGASGKALVRGHVRALQSNGQCNRSKVAGVGVSVYGARQKIDKAGRTLHAVHGESLIQ